MPEIHTIAADKRWGHGRLVRRFARFRCRLLGHVWCKWAFDWPYDVFDMPEESGLLDERGNVRDPHPDEELIWARGCRFDCGVVQTTRCSLHDAGTLPDDRTALFDNPIRRMVKR